MTVRAHVDFDHGRFGVAIWLGEDGGPGTEARVGEPINIVMAPRPEGVITEPTLRLPDNVARALLDALAAYFGGTSDMQTLRKDYLAERARVDKMIDHLTGDKAGA